MTTGDGGLSPSSSVVPAVDAPPPFFAVDDSATGTGTATATATGDAGGHPGDLAGSRRRRLELVRPKFEEKAPAVEADGKKPLLTSGVAEDGACSSGNGASGLPTPRKIWVAGRRHHTTDTSKKGPSSPRLALPAMAATSEAMRQPSKRRKLVRPSFEGPVRTLRIKDKADAWMAVQALKTGQDLKIAISEDLALGEASGVAEVILPFYPRVLEGPDLLLLCNKISEEAAVNSRLQINQSALAVLETQSRDLNLSIARDMAVLHQS